MTRPLPITVIAWVIIATSSEGLVGLLGGFVAPLFSTGTLQTPFSVSTTVWAGTVTLVIYVALALLMLRGLGWARIVYVCLLAISLVGLVVGQQPLSLALITAAKLGIFSYYLFRRESNEYFSNAIASA